MTLIEWCAAIMCGAFLIGMAVGAVLGWDCFSRVPREEPEDYHDAKSIDA